MREIIFVVGLPGSGKSTYIKRNFFDLSKYVVFDDVNVGSVLNCNMFTFSINYPAIVQEMESGNKNIVISDIDFCRQDKFRDALEVLKWWNDNKSLGYSIKCIFFENAPEKCRRNSEREMKRRLDEIREYAILYDRDKMKADYCTNQDLDIDEG